MSWRLLAAVVVLGVCLPASSSANSVTVTERLLTTNAAADFDAAISGNHVVFTTTRAGSPDIYHVDLATTLVQALVIGPSGQQQADISGTTVVYVDGALGDLNIYATDVLTGVSRLLTVIAAADDRPAVSGTDVAFVTNRAGNKDIYHIDLTTDLVAAVTNTANFEALPAIDAGTVVFERAVGLSIDVYGTDVGGSEFPVAVGAGDARTPSISGNLVAYIEDGDVALFDISTGQRTPITADAALQRNVVVDGNHVMWSDDRNGNLDIFLYDVTDGQEYQLTTDPADQLLNDVDGGNAVFEDNRLGDSNIWQLAFSINHAPTADAGADQNAIVGSTVQLNGSGSDADGDVLSFAWTLESAPAGSTATLSDPTAASPLFVPDRAGQYVFSLVTHDGSEGSTPAITMLTVAPNLPPSAVAGATPVSGVVPLLVLFDSTGSSDPEAGSLSFSWDFGDLSPLSPAPNPSHTYLSPGTYVATLTVTDDQGQTDTDTVTIVVSAPNQAPSAAPTATPNTGPAPLSVAFVANGSDPEGGPLSYAWDFGDPGSGANTSSNANPGHTYSNPGTYTVSLTVSDGALGASESLTIVVSPTASLSVRFARVDWRDDRPNQGRIQLRADFSAPLPGPGDRVGVTFDGITLVEAPFASFELDDDGAYVFKTQNAFAKLDFVLGELKAFRRKQNLLDLDNANGVDVELMIGSAMAVENIPMASDHPQRLEYKRD